MKVFKQALWLGPALMVLVACETAPRVALEETYDQVYVATGALQCEDNAERVPALAQRLRDEGVRVEMASCGHDGLARVAMCGAPDGSIGVFVVPRSDMPRARELGFEPFAHLPDARVQPCAEQIENELGSPDPAAS